jgi:hypothetical protein
MEFVCLYIYIYIRSEVFTAFFYVYISQQHDDFEASACRFSEGTTSWKEGQVNGSRGGGGGLRSSWMQLLAREC